MSKRNFFHKTQQRHYQTKRFRNPYFQTQQIQTHVVMGVIVAGIVGFIVLLGFFLHRDGFTINRVDVNGIRHFSEATFAETVRSYLHEPVFIVFDHRHRLFFDEDVLQKKLSDVFAFESIGFSRNGRTLTIDLIEKQSQLIWMTAAQSYLVGLDGHIIRELSDQERELFEHEEKPEDASETRLFRELPLFVDLNAIAVIVGSPVLTVQEVNNIFRFHKHLALQKIVVTQTQVDRVAGKWIGVKTEQGYNILFDALGDIDQQAARLEVLLREKVEDPSQLEYIDLRFGDRAYFK